MSQIDVTYEFFKGKFDEDIYVEQPHEHYVRGEEERVCRFSLYGLKQAPIYWYNESDTYFLKNNF